MRAPNDGITETRVTGFRLIRDELEITIERDVFYTPPGSGPDPADIPPDYLAAVTDWIARSK